MLLLLHAHLLLALQLLKLRLKLGHLRIDVRLLSHKGLKINAVQLRKLRNRGLRIAGQLFRVGHKLTNSANGVHPLHLPILLVGTQDFVQRVKPLAIVRVLLLLFRDIALLLFPQVLPRLGHRAELGMACDLAERLLVRLAPNGGGLKGREFCRYGRRVNRLGRGGRVRAGGFDSRLQVIAQ